MNLTLCLTHDCNLRCGYCYAGRKSRKSMSWEVARAAIDFAVSESLDAAARQNGRPKLTLGFFGGEPLLEWELLKRCNDYIAARSERHGIALSSTLTTNMTLLDTEKVNWLNNHGYFLGLSLDGNAAMHDIWRRYADGRGSHDDCRKALRFFRDESSRAEIIVVVDPRNVMHLSDSVRWLTENSPLKIALNPNFGACWDDASLDLLTREYHLVADYYVERYRQGAPFRINILDGKIKTHLWGGYRDCDKCSFGEREIAVSVAGNFYPCARLVGEDDGGELVFGNVRTGYDRAKRIRHILRRGNRTEACTRCTLRDRCMNWCGCVNYVTSQGNIDEVGPFTCFHERLGIRVSDQAAKTLWDEKNPYFLTRFYKNCLDEANVTVP